MKEIYEELQTNNQSANAIDEELFNKHLMTHNYPDPELLIVPLVSRELVTFNLASFIQ